MLGTVVIWPSKLQIQDAPQSTPELVNYTFQRPSFRSQAEEEE